MSRRRMRMRHTNLYGVTRLAMHTYVFRRASCRVLLTRFRSRACVSPLPSPLPLAEAGVIAASRRRGNTTMMRITLGSTSSHVSPSDAAQPANKYVSN
eukprot:scaffold34815_cov63-Phaeocystis_antarctica.AAC.2